ncbi:MULTISPECIES: 8-amino-7-oxononanoate synthase [unclassified Coleofasciculus]|uniref:8-amino-7-oxononanoate synthase n=1 Tax=unclassified Coleofasciculus TaxID=2692782 RepID=UPI0018824CF8|nr:MULTISPECIES: 8-amino-7-oxononanoate synthase [unclassified Coleofasciculus]MBE9128397.1 8-amino-7-oxononanoate synthase [Coleofasciculus sp. LEGE 07081]MBE9150351.1 8-amino-7-oxononanoate synthase [Coleofasciculus sp. LEGE 07092]
MPTNPYAWLDQSLATIHNANWYRSVKTLQRRPGAVVQLEGQEVINFASNDYLGLAGDERLIQAAVTATKEYGTGSTGSRLLSGHREVHQELEGAIAFLKQTQEALVFSSGYLANLGTIAALVGKRDLILADQYNHSSLKNGAILSGAAIVNYAHCDIKNLTHQLTQHRHNYRRCLILTDSVFSMDGDLCPLPQLLLLAEDYSCMVLVDEAHATGVLGATGAGCVEHFGCTGQPVVQVGTLSKALGSLGGYVAGSAPLIDFLRNRAPSWIYTTALSPADTAAALAAIEIIQKEPERRTRLWDNVETLKQLLTKQLSHLRLLPSESPILCIQLASATEALTVGQQLKAAGIFAPAIRPPTVPTSRIRLSVMATHERVHLEKVVNTLKALKLPN